MRRALALAMVIGCGDSGGGGGDEMTTSASTSTSTSMPTSMATSMSSTATTATTTPTTADDSGTTSIDETTTGIGESSSETMIPEVSFAGEVEPILQARCSCHLSAAGPAGLDMSLGNAYDNLVGVASTQLATLNRIESGQPQQSYLYLKVTDTHGDVGGVGIRMPRTGPALEDAQIDTIRHWIKGGVMP